MNHICCEVCGSSAIKKTGEDRFQCQRCGVEYSKADLRLLFAGEKKSGETDTEPTVPPQETAVHSPVNEEAPAEELLEEETPEEEPSAPKYNVTPPLPYIVQHREWEESCAVLSAEELYERITSPDAWQDTQRMVCYQELLRRDLVRDPDDNLAASISEYNTNETNTKKIIAVKDVGDYMNVGDKIREQRIKLGLSQEELALKMGYNGRSTIEKIESGAVEVSHTKVVQYAKILGVSVDYLLGTDDDSVETNAIEQPAVHIIAVVAVLLAVVVAVLVVAPKIFVVSVDDLCAQGNYEKAYEKADDDEKMAIRAENAAAVQSVFSAEHLKDPDSFKLRDAYYNEGTNEDGETTKQLVLHISGANSYGATVSSYWLYSWGILENQKWSYIGSVSDLTEEESSSYDDEDEALEKAINNINRLTIKNIMNYGIELSKDAVKRINTMFEEGSLDEVELLDVDYTIQN